jgi:hypothetical protein
MSSEEDKRPRGNNEFAARTLAILEKTTAALLRVADRVKKNERETERRLNFILEQQAQFAANIGQLEESQTQFSTNMNQLLELHRAADTRLTRMETSLTSLLAIGEMHEQELSEQRELGKATDKRLNVLINTVERYIEGRNGKS